jgi:hypothetical protein
MTQPLPDFIEASLQIAWDFLGGSGEIANPHQTAEFLLRNMRDRALRGESRPLMLANRAIDAHRQQRQVLAA